MALAAGAAPVDALASVAATASDTITTPAAVAAATGRRNRACWLMDRKEISSLSGEQSRGSPAYPRALVTRGGYLFAAWSTKLTVWTRIRKIDGVSLRVVPGLCLPVEGGVCPT